MILAKIRVDGVNATIEKLHDIPKGIMCGQLQFEFSDPLWKDLTKTVVFHGAVTKDVIYTGDVIAIPPECVAVAGVHLMVGVHGVGPGVSGLPTVMAYLGRVLDAADPSGDTTTNTELPVWAQLLSIIGDVSNLNTDAKENLVVAINEALTKGGGVIDQDELERLITDEVYIISPGESLDDVPEDAKLVIAPDSESGVVPPDVVGDVITGAKAGQTIKITEVDGNGVPVAWEPVDFPSDGKSAYDYAKDAGFSGTEDEFAEKLSGDNVNLAGYATEQWVEDGFQPKGETGVYILDEDETVDDAPEEADVIIDPYAKFEGDFAVTAENEVLCVTIEGNEADGYTTDTDTSEIYRAFEAGKFVYCIINISEIDVLLPLIASGDRISVFSASTAMGAFEVKIVENIVEEVNAKEHLTEDLIDEKLTGVVKSVNGIAPDANGNVKIPVPDSGGNVNQARADWDEANATAYGFINNRTHYCTYRAADLLYERTISFAESKDIKLNERIGLEPDKYYRVLWDGAGYDVKAGESTSGGWVILQYTVANSVGFPGFVITEYNEETAQSKGYSLRIQNYDVNAADVTIRIYSTTETVIPLDKKYLPELTASDVGAVATVNGIAPDENGNVQITIPDSEGADVFWVTVRGDNTNGYYCENTNAEIYEAYKAGKILYCKLYMDGILIFMSLAVVKSDSASFCAFSGNTVYNVGVNSGVTELVITPYVSYADMEQIVEGIDSYVDERIDEKLEGFVPGSGGNVDLTIEGETLVIAENSTATIDGETLIL